MELKFKERDVVRKKDGQQEMIIARHLTNLPHIIISKIKGNKPPELEKVAIVRCIWQQNGVTRSKNIEEPELFLVKDADGST